MPTFPLLTLLEVLATQLHERKQEPSELGKKKEHELYCKGHDDIPRKTWRINDKTNIIQKFSKYLISELLHPQI